MPIYLKMQLHFTSDHNYQNEIRRLQIMLSNELSLYNSGYKLVAGADEAGRGPLAGPVVAAAVILDPKVLIPGINDSKKLNESRRNLLYDEIVQKSISFGIAVIDNNTIDELNILRASLEAIRKAVCEMPIQPDFLLVDGNHLPMLNLPMKPIVSGDSLSLSIAAASILAKVTRDRIMLEYDIIYPQYGFKKNKGYPTKEHLSAIRKYGACKIHRKSFSPINQLVMNL